VTWYFRALLTTNFVFTTHGIMDTE